MHRTFLCGQVKGCITQPLVVLLAVVVVSSNCSSGTSTRRSRTVAELTVELQSAGLTCGPEEFGDSLTRDQRACRLVSGEFMEVQTFSNNDDRDRFLASATLTLAGTTSRFLVVGNRTVLHFEYRATAERGARATSGKIRPLTK